MGKTRGLRRYHRKSNQVKSHVKPFSNKSRKRATKHKKNKLTVKRRLGVKNRKSRRIIRKGGVASKTPPRYSIFRPGSGVKKAAADVTRATARKFGVSEDSIASVLPTKAQRIQMKESERIEQLNSAVEQLKSVIQEKMKASPEVLDEHIRMVEELIKRENIELGSDDFKADEQINEGTNLISKIQEANLRRKAYEQKVIVKAKDIWRTSLDTYTTNRKMDIHYDKILPTINIETVGTKREVGGTGASGEYKPEIQGIKYDDSKNQILQVTGTANYDELFKLVNDFIINIYFKGTDKEIGADNIFTPDNLYATVERRRLLRDNGNIYNKYIIHWDKHRIDMAEKWKAEQKDILEIEEDTENQGKKFHKLMNDYFVTTFSQDVVTTYNFSPDN